MFEKNVKIREMTQNNKEKESVLCEKCSSKCEL